MLHFRGWNRLELAPRGLKAPPELLRRADTSADWLAQKHMIHSQLSFLGLAPGSQRVTGESTVYWPPPLIAFAKFKGRGRKNRKTS